MLFPLLCVLGKRINLFFSVVQQYAILCKFARYVGENLHMV
jgi:hypothetical protein